VGRDSRSGGRLVLGEGRVAGSVTRIDRHALSSCATVDDTARRLLVMPSPAWHNCKGRS
jgi:hypothetical protein